jgi:hypothetical protein
MSSDKKEIQLLTFQDGTVQVPGGEPFGPIKKSGQWTSRAGRVHRTLATKCGRPIAILFQEPWILVTRPRDPKESPFGDLEQFIVPEDVGNFLNQLCSDIGSKNNFKQVRDVASCAYWGQPTVSVRCPHGLDDLKRGDRVQVVAHLKDTVDLASGNESYLAIQITSYKRESAGDPPTAQEVCIPNPFN